MLSRIIESRRHVVDWNELKKWVVNGKYSVKCAYIDRIYQRLILQNRLPTKDRLIKMGMLCDASCALCQQDVEDRIHLFHGCSFILKTYTQHIFFPCPSSSENVMADDE